MRSILKSVASLCLVLTVWSAVAFATHHHSSATESVQCAVCIATHAAAPKAPASLFKATLAPVSTFQAKPVSAQRRLVVFALSVRPPPTV